MSYLIGFIAGWIVGGSLGFLAAAILGAAGRDAEQGAEAKYQTDTAWDLP